MNTYLRLLAMVGLVTIAPAFSACAYAQNPHDGYYGRVDSRAFEIGYREGLQAGRRDARRNRPNGFQYDNDYRRADKGWNWRYGDRVAYRYEFRRGYERGYREAYRNDSGYRDRGYGYPQYPSGSYGGSSRGQYGYRSPAAQYGYEEGYQKGREDARDNDRYDPVRQKWYREGDRHYNSRYGSRDQWKSEYRDAFRQGYDRGYREGR